MLKFKTIILGLSLLVGATTRLYAQSTNYYIAANGNDSNSGTSQSSPFKTIAKLNRLVLKPGDVINFRRGDIFSGQLVIQQSGTPTNNICVDAYGSGDKPVIMGSLPVKGWKKVNGNIWQASFTDATARVNGVYIGDDDLPLGVYPNPDEQNDGFLTIQSHVGNKQVTSSQPLNTTWTGGEIVIRKNAWDLDRSTIMNKSGNTLTVNDSGSAIQDNWGFFIQNHPATLDRNGEWYFDNDAKKLMLYYTKGDPNDAQIRASVFNAGIIVRSASNVSIQNVVIRQTQKNGISGQSVNALKIANTGIYQSGEDAISVQGTGSNVTISNNVIDGAYNNAVIVYGHKGLTLSSNTIKNIGLVAGRGKNGSGAYTAVRYNLKNGQALIQDNTIQNVGYSGIDFRSSNVTVQRNLIKNFGLTKTDGGGIYTFSGKGANYVNQRILSNIVLNGAVTKKGMYKSNSSAHGIYMDDCSRNIDVQNNTVANCSGSGIFLHGTSNVKVAQNTCYNNANQLLVSYSKCGESVGNSILSNVFAGKRQQSISKNVTRLLRSSVSLDQTNKQVQDADDDKSVFEYNATNTSKVITLNGTYRDVNNKTYSGKVTLQPFSSIVLMK